MIDHVTSAPISKSLKMVLICPNIASTSFGTQGLQVLLNPYYCCPLFVGGPLHDYDGTLGPQVLPTIVVVNW